MTEEQNRRTESAEDQQIPVLKRRSVHEGMVAVMRVVPPAAVFVAWAVVSPW